MSTSRTSRTTQSTPPHPATRAAVRSTSTAVSPRELLCLALPTGHRGQQGDQFQRLRRRQRGLRRPRYLGVGPRTIEVDNCQIEMNGQNSAIVAGANGSPTQVSVTNSDYDEGPASPKKQVRTSNWATASVPIPRQLSRMAFQPPRSRRIGRFELNPFSADASLHTFRSPLTHPFTRSVLR